MTPMKTILAFVFAVILMVLATGVYTVREGQQALLLRLGKIVTNAQGEADVKRPGLHFKTPLIDRVVKLDMRLQTSTAKSSKIYIDRQDYFFIDYFIKWRIVDLPTYYTATSGSPMRAELLMQQNIDNALRAEFGTRDLREIVARDSTTNLKAKAEEKVRDLGVTVVDVRLRGIDLPTTVRESVFNQMVTDRKKEANQARSEGEREAKKIRGNADAERIEIIADANRQAEETRAMGLAKAAQIYAAAYTKNPEFYSFHRSLSAYEKAFSNHKDVLLLQPEGDFFKYFNQLQAQ
jgi:membrane protease subunit HflC